MGTAPVIDVGERLDRTTAAEVVASVDAQLAGTADRLVVDLGRVSGFDSAGLGAVVEGMRRAQDRGVELRLRGMSQPMMDFFSLVTVERLLSRSSEKAAPLDAFSHIGAIVLPALATLAGIGRTAVETLEALFVAPFRGKRLRLDRTILEVDQAAGGAAPIVALIAFLLGLILAMQAWVQLRVWGAEIYVANMVGVSVVTEIGPLMTAIILAARSGSSNAAQLGSMVVGEEIDALKQMGIHPMRFLVVPKVLALMFAVVALGVVFDVIALCGGALFAYAMAGIEVGAYKQQAQTALHLSDFIVAMCKSVAFGACIGVVGCSLGLRVRGGSEGVGRATTNAVVLSIFLIIVVDSLFVTAQRLLL